RSRRATERASLRAYSERHGICLALPNWSRDGGVGAGTYDRGDGGARTERLLELGSGEDSREEPVVRHSTQRAGESTGGERNAAARRPGAPHAGGESNAVRPRRIPATTFRAWPED